MENGPFESLLIFITLVTENKRPTPIIFIDCSTSDPYVIARHESNIFQTSMILF